MRVGAGLALIAALAVALAAWLRPAAPELLVRVACEFAVEVDGVLRCDDEAPRDVASVCGDGTSGALNHGDAIVRASLCTGGSPRPGGLGWGRMRGDDLEALAVPVDLNRASASELESMPGIGPELARRIIEGRPYSTVDDLQRVRGIGPARLTAVRQRGRVTTTSGQGPSDRF
ncbi:ComEA family DNA-binding protein [Nannocystis radixulma]|uniref:Helix-hairpin-helix domain-containing protein n=1 Tax=Nannocystis radixulma TaxID=2995305 RepID=A0ABT5BIT4_9BACT|nr:helix-hairpin-helix domain-containing protein [Nannocystis radixulma]MDC0674066.1 helix-hairpin-helix domain-containing protein [Nannocystis radixulma]